MSARWSVYVSVKLLMMLNNPEEIWAFFGAIGKTNSKWNAFKPSLISKLFFFSRKQRNKRPSLGCWVRWRYFFPISREKWTDFVVIDVVENSALKSSSAFLKKSSRAPKQHHSCSGRRVWRHLWTLGRLKGGDCFWGTDRARYGQFLWHLGNMGKHLTIFEWLWYVRTVLG